MEQLFSSVDTIWVLLGAALVFFMQAGFAMVETGFTRAKNAGNIIMKNLMDFAIGTPIFWILGFGLMFGGTGALIGGFDFLIKGDYSFLGLSIPLPAFIIFQTVFCATAATIVSGAMAERTKFASYCVYSAVISAVIYPISGHWIWGGGWLAQLGFHDFAGSTAVHLVGGVAALVGAKILGPRIGKYDKNGKPRAILGHSLTLGALGVFILWFCWFGFNGGSTLSMTGDESLTSAGSIFLTTNLSAAVATVSTMIITWVRYKKPDISMTLNGSLAGLVAVTAGGDKVTPVGAFFIGLIASFVVVFGIEFVDKILKIDDPVGAIGVHGFCGAAGTLLTGLFAADKGLFYTGDFSFFGVQVLGVVSVAVWVAVTMTIVFMVIKKTIGLRASEEEEIRGLDVTEHGISSSYADFMPTTAAVPGVLSGRAESSLEIPAEEDAIPAVQLPSGMTVAKVGDRTTKMTKIAMVFSQERLEALKNAMNSIGVTGMTVTQVLGYGTQKGHEAYYRGVKLEDVKLLPKVKVEIVVSKVPVQTVIDTARKALYTGNVGDGKLFVYDVEDTVRVRTGEHGYDALQGDD